MDFKRGEEIMKKQKFSVWKSIKIGNNETKVVYKKSLEEGGYFDCRLGTINLIDVSLMFSHPLFVISTEEIKINLVKVTVEELGLNCEYDRLNYENICKKAFQHGLDFCPAEVGLQLMLEDKAIKTEDGNLYVAINPMQMNKCDIKNIFSLINFADNNYPVLRNCHKGPLFLTSAYVQNRAFYHHNEFVFIQRVVNGMSVNEKIKKDNAIKEGKTTWKTVSVGTKLKTINDFSENFLAFKYTDILSKDIFDKLEFTVAAKEDKINLVKMSGYDLGFDKEFTLKDTYNRIISLGFNPCSMESALQCVLQSAANSGGSLALGGGYWNYWDWEKGCDYCVIVDSSSQNFIRHQLNDHTNDVVALDLSVGIGLAYDALEVLLLWEKERDYKFSPEKTFVFVGGGGD